MKKRQRLGESLDVSDLERILTGASDDSSICRKHYLSLYHSITASSKNLCPICSHETKKKHLQPVFYFKSGAGPESFVFTEIISSLLLNAEVHREESRLSASANAESQGIDTDLNDVDRTSQKAKRIYETRTKVCLRCNSTIKRKLGKQLSSPEDGFPNGIFHSLCMEYEADLLGKDSIGMTASVSEMYEKYKNSLALAFETQREMGNQKKAATSYRSFVRILEQQSRLCVVRNCTVGKRRGSILASFEIVRQLVSDGVEAGVSESFNSTNIFKDIQPELRELCKRYRQMEVIYKEPNFDIVEEIKAVPNLLWAYKHTYLESYRERIMRRLILKENGGDVMQLPFPFGNRGPLSMELIQIAWVVGTSFVQEGSSSTCSDTV